ncbi:hypothetical protein [Nocardia fusca]|uniref:hypothetical protein n=1 Tax=Nocardia fusca TaxID=941183 RepID=UPI0007A7456F|nr:hypothetical protein [Nocardia fusca]
MSSARIKKPDLPEYMTWEELERLPEELAEMSQSAEQSPARRQAVKASHSPDRERGPAGGVLGMHTSARPPHRWATEEDYRTAVGGEADDIGAAHDNQDDSWKQDGVK